MRSAILDTLLMALVAVVPGVWAHAGQICSNIASDVTPLSKHERIVLAATSAGLHYNPPAYDSGYRRISISSEGSQKALFAYADASDRELTDSSIIQRLDAVGIPPAHKNVWISSDPHSHIQGISHDSKGKVQYFYHPRWIEITGELKFQRMIQFGRSLPRLMNRIKRDLAQVGLPKTKVVATVTQLLKTTLIRVGNLEGVQNNESFGLTTMLKSHFISVAPLTLHFKGKSNKWHTKVIPDLESAGVLRDLLRLPGKNLFQYQDERGNVHTISSDDVNDYIKAAMGPDFSAKDFRTWMASYYAAEYLSRAPRSATEKQTLSLFSKASEYAASHLGNTAAVCRASYIHPKIFAAYADPETFFAAFRVQNPTADPTHNGLLELLESNID